MKRSIGVHLGAQATLVGRLHYNRDGARESAVFEYDDAWLATRSAFALDPTLPLVRGAQFHKAARDGLCLYSLLSENWGMAFA